MKSAFTIHIKEETLERAKSYAASQGRDLEELMEVYLYHLAAGCDRREVTRREIDHFVERIQEDLEWQTEEADAKKDYRRYLIEKYR